MENKEKKEPKIACCNCFFFGEIQETPILGTCRFDPPKIERNVTQGNVNGFRGPVVRSEFVPILPASEWNSFCHNFNPAREVAEEYEKKVEAFKVKASGSRPSIVT